MKCWPNCLINSNVSDRSNVYLVIFFTEAFIHPQFQTVVKKSGPSVSRYLVGLVEEQTEVGEDHPQFLPAVTVLKLPQQVARQLVL